MNKKAERGRATREQLVEIATGLFVERGYEDTSIEAVLQETDVSRGALYHHFDGKEALFEAVLTAVEADIASRLNASVGGLTDPVEELRAGCLAWVRLAGDRVVQRIVLIDAPSVVGWERRRELDEKYTLGMVRAVLSGVARTGRLPEAHVDLFAHMLLAALDELALLIARAEDVEGATLEAEAAIEEFVTRILTPPRG